MTRLQTGIRCVGRLTVWTRRGAGPWRRHGRRSNRVVTTGVNLIRDLLNGDAVNGLTHFAVGTDATAPADAQTTLVAEVFRAALTSKTKASGKLTAKYFLGTSSANGNTLREAGLLNASSVGTLYARALVAPAIAKTSSISVTFQWELTFEAT